MGPDRSRESQAELIHLPEPLTWTPSLPSTPFNPANIPRRRRGRAWAGPRGAPGKGGLLWKPQGGQEDSGAGRTRGRQCPRSWGADRREPDTPPEPSQVSPNLARPWVWSGPSPAFLSQLRSERRASPMEKHSGHLPVSAHSHPGRQHAEGVSRVACMCDRPTCP